MMLFFDKKNVLEVVQSISLLGKSIPEWYQSKVRVIRVRQPEKQQWRKVQNQLLYAFNNMSAKFELLLQSRSEVNRANLENVI